MNEIQIFKHQLFGTIRTMTDDDGIPLFVGKDVAKALGYKNPSNALQAHVDEEDKTTYLNQVSGSKYKTTTLMVNESGLYSLVLSSKLPQARQFKRWVTAEVLPQIRKTGGYIPTRDAEGRKLSNEQIVERAFQMEPELATGLRAQQGSWAAKNDLELKSFHNEYAGVDYANDASVNGIIQVNWNQVVTGTPESMGRKIRPSMVLDGLVTRLVLFPMPDNDFVMIDRRKLIRDHDRDCFLRSVGITLEQVKGELKADRLVDFCYDYKAKLTNEARLEEDYCLDCFRKRIPVIMMRYTLVRMVLRQLDNVRKGEPLVVEDDDLEFARLIGDWCLMAQMHMFGNMVMDAQEREKNQFVPRRRSTKTRDTYASLPKTFTKEYLVSAGHAKDAHYACQLLRRWMTDGLVTQNDNVFTKNFNEIPV